MCTGCRQWVNLGKGQGQLLGSCHSCGAEVVWRGHAQLQSWVQCDACGRWRSVPDHTLRYSLLLNAGYTSATDRSTAGAVSCMWQLVFCASPHPWPQSLIQCLLATNCSTDGGGVGEGGLRTAHDS